MKLFKYITLSSCSTTLKNFFHSQPRVKKKDSINTNNTGDIFIQEFQILNSKIPLTDKSYKKFFRLFPAIRTFVESVVEVAMGVWVVLSVLHTRCEAVVLIASTNRLVKKNFLDLAFSIIFCNCSLESWWQRWKN